MYRSAALIATLALVLVACGGATTPAATSTLVAPTVAAPVATTEAAAPATAATTTAARDSIYAALSQSVDADGYYVLGNVNAPAVMTHYSDLL